MLQQPQDRKIDIGLPNQTCVYCGAKFWNKERNTKGAYTKCCQNGSVALFPNETTKYMSKLFSGKNLIYGKVFEFFH
jgi:hypothetical protein